jgi:hypothetical protein
MSESPYYSVDEIEEECVRQWCARQPAEWRWLWSAASTYLKDRLPFHNNQMGEIQDRAATMSGWKAFADRGVSIPTWCTGQGSEGVDVGNAAHGWCRRFGSMFAKPVDKEVATDEDFKRGEMEAFMLACTYLLSYELLHLAYAVDDVDTVTQ